jgi:TolB-like protein/class 3 adenylate cyclase
MSQSRQLAAIMFTDIVGYTALMGKDSDKAMELVDVSKEIQMPLVEKHHGKWLKEMGDGAMAQFTSALDAVNCAMEIQENVRVKLDAKLRIGIHSGDITIKNNDIYGDGVNVAARLESIADPGGIYISESIEKAIRGQTNIQAKFLGEIQLKNVDYGVRTYALQGAGLPVPDLKGKKLAGGLLGQLKQPGAGRVRIISMLIGLLMIAVLGWIAYNKYIDYTGDDASTIEKSIAVLPFRNDSPNEENLYFCNGIMEGILNHLAKIPELTVISRTSVEQYRENPPSIVEIARELNVNYILEGSVLRIGDRVQISAQLINALEDKHLWSDQFDKNIETADIIFQVLAEVTKNIGRALKANISPEVQERIESVPTSDITAYDYFLQGKEHYYNWWRTHDNSNLTNAHRLFDLAIKQDSTFGLAYAGKAAVFGRSDFVENYLDSVRIYCDKAILLDPNAAFAYVIRGKDYYMMGINDMKKARMNLKKAVELSPNDDFMVRNLAIFYAKNEEYITALEFFKRAEKIGRDPTALAATYHLMGYEVYLGIGDMDKALYFINKSIEINPLWKGNNWWYYLITGKFQRALEIKKTTNQNPGSTYTYMRGKSDSAVQYLDQLEAEKKVKEGESYVAETANFRYGIALIDVGRTVEGMAIINYHLNRFEQGMNAGTASSIEVYNVVGIYSFLGETDKAIESLKILNKNYPWVHRIYMMQVDLLFDNIRDSEEYKEIVNTRLVENTRIREEINKLEAAGEL